MHDDTAPSPWMTKTSTLLHRPSVHEWQNNVKKIKICVIKSSLYSKSLREENPFVHNFCDNKKQRGNMSNCIFRQWSIFQPSIVLVPSLPLFLASTHFLGFSCICIFCLWSTARKTRCVATSVRHTLSEHLKVSWTIGRAPLPFGTLVLKRSRGKSKMVSPCSTLILLAVAACYSVVSGGPAYRMSSGGSGCGVGTEIKWARQFPVNLLFLCWEKILCF